MTRRWACPVNQTSLLQPTTFGVSTEKPNVTDGVRREDGSRCVTVNAGKRSAPISGNHAPWLGSVTERTARNRRRWVSVRYLTVSPNPVSSGPVDAVEEDACVADALFRELVRCWDADTLTLHRTLFLSDAEVAGRLSRFLHKLVSQWFNYILTRCQ